MLFIAVALGLIVAGLRFYEQSRLSSMVADHTRLLNGIVTEMRDANMRTGRVAIWTDLVDGDGNPVWAADPPWRDVASYLAKAGAVPGNALAENGAVHDMVGRPMPLFVGTVEIEPMLRELGPGYIAGFQGKVSVEECTRMTPTTESGSGRAGHGISQVYLFSEDTAGNQTDGLFFPPFSPSDAATECQRFFDTAVADGLMMFTFRP
ncbi:MAG TPA: hypothetical protein DDY29_11030 [Rhodobacteraceae bacterium]|nr:hypothetical protein [Paracoccaceae bacterium]